MKILSFARRRPIVILTLFYAALLIILDQSHFFNRLARLVPAHAEGAITAHVVSVETRPPVSENLILDNIVLDGLPQAYRALCRVSADSAKAGDIVSLEGTIEPPAEPSNPGEFDYRTYLHRQGIDALIIAGSLQATGHIPPPWWQTLSSAIGERCVNVLKDTLSEGSAAILVPMVIGDKSLLDRETKTAFTRAGAMHILVVSGMNVAYVAVVCLFFLKLLGLPKRQASLASLPFILLYVLVTGAQAPAVRAGVMAVMVIIALSLKREPLVWHALIVAALCILAFDPQSLFTASFQLSFAATIGIVALYRPFLSAFESTPRPVASLLGPVIATTLAAQLAVMPIIAWYFNRVQLIGLVSNILIVPLSGVLTIGGFVLCCLGMAAPAITQPLAAVCDWGTQLLDHIVRFFAAIPHGTVIVGAFPLWLFLPYSGFLASLSQATKSPRRAWLAAGICFLITAAGWWLSIPSRGDVRVTFLAVGNADTIVFESGGKTWLIDAGEPLSGRIGTAERIILPFLRSRGISSIDTAVITHPHHPHYGALREVSAQIPIRRLLVNNDLPRSPEYHQLLENMAKQGSVIAEAAAGMNYFVGKTSVSVLLPEVQRGNPDDDSLVLLLESNGVKMLLTSDLGAWELTYLIKRYPGLHADVVELPNHGKRAGTQQLLELTKPRAIIVSGNEPVELSRNYLRYTTDTQGAVRITIRKGSYSIKPFITTSAAGQGAD